MKPNSLAVAILRPLAIVSSLILALLGVLWWCTWMPGAPHGGELAPLSEAEQLIERNLRGHVATLAGELSPRNLDHEDNYTAARDYLREHLEALGPYEVSLQKVPAGDRLSFNVVATWRGRAHPDEVVVLGAHYDSKGDVTPGADDNASGVAAGLELARLFAARGEPPARTVRFVFYANEEPPHFQNPGMGSRADADALAEQGADVIVMFSLEMLGYYDDAPGTQRYPPVLKWFYPDTGDFVAFVGRITDRAEVTCATGRLRELDTFPAYGFAGPSFIEGIDYSDHWSYWQRDYRAVMVTDTSFFRNSNYHRASDTPDTLDYPRFARVVHGLDTIFWRWLEEGGC